MTHEGGESDELACWAVYARRCTSTSESSTVKSTNCKVDECTVKARKGGEVTVEASLKHVGDCPIPMKSYALRLRRVKP